MKDATVSYMLQKSIKYNIKHLDLGNGALTRSCYLTVFVRERSLLTCLKLNSMSLSCRRFSQPIAIHFVSVLIFSP